MSAYRDVTSQARAEAERERLLASEREENRRLAELDAYRSESIAAVSHELRTPLTSIVGYTQLLRSMLDPVSSPEEVAALDAIVRNVDRLLRLAGDVVALDSLESRALPLPVSPVEFGEVLRRAVSTVGPEARAKGIDISLTASVGPPVRGDEDRLGQLFDNLLSNAVKFTPEDGRVRVRASPDGGGWRVTVNDTGIGIPSDELALLFTRFFRASNARTRGFPGAGLGLSVARAIAERHGGWIEVDSHVGAGTTVMVHIADAPEEMESGLSGSGPASQRSGPR
jgi:signal transduction histidine kinase